MIFLYEERLILLTVYINITSSFMSSTSILLCECILIKGRETVCESVYLYGTSSNKIITKNIYIAQSFYS